MLLPLRETAGVEKNVENMAVVPLLPTLAVGLRPRCNGPNPVHCTFPLGTEATFPDPVDAARTVVAWFEIWLISFWVGHDGGAAILLFDFDIPAPSESTSVTLLVEEEATHATSGS